MTLNESNSHGKSHDIINELATGSSFIAVGLFVSAFVQLLINIILSRLLGADGIGLLSIVIRFTSLVSTLIILGIPTVTTHLVAASKDNEQKKKVYSNALITLIILSLLATVLIAFFSEDIASFFGIPEIMGLLMIQCIGFPLSSALLISAAYLRGVLQFQKYAILQIISPSANLLLVIYFATFQILTPTLAIISGVVGTGLSALTGVFLVKIYKIQRPSKELLKSIAFLGMPLLVVGLVGTAIDSMDVLILQILGYNLDLIGAYSNAFMLSTYLRYIVEPIALAIMPIASGLISAKMIKETQTILNASIRVITTFFVPLILYIGITSEQIMLVLYPPEFAIASPSLLILSLGTIGLALYYLNSRIIIAYAKNSMLSIMMAIAGISDIILTIVLGWRFGLIGAAFSSAITFLFMAGITSIYNKRKINLRYDFRKRDLSSWIVIVVLDYLTLKSLSSIFNSSEFLGNVVILVIVFIVTVLVLFLMKPLSPIDTALLLDIINRNSIPQFFRTVFQKIILLLSRD